MKAAAMPLSVGGLCYSSASIKITPLRTTSLVSLLSHPMFKFQPLIGIAY